MLKFKNPTPGNITQSRTVLALVAATLLVGGSVTEASAKSRHHHRHHHHSHHASNSPTGSSWRDANASIAPSSGSGRSFSGLASFYGNESGSKTASGQRFNQNAMTAAHRSLPFGTKLRVTHGSQSVVVTINDRGPFIRGRVIDLSPAAARALRIDGLANVTLTW
jgi:rare lipoprotein A